MHGHIDSHQVHWYAWGNISASTSAAPTLHNQALTFLTVLLCRAASLSVSYLHFSLCLCQTEMCSTRIAIMEYSIAREVWYNVYNTECYKQTTNDLCISLYTL